MLIITFFQISSSLVPSQPGARVEVCFSQPAEKCMKNCFSVEQLRFVLLLHKLLTGADPGISETGGGGVHYCSNL